ncbi:MAG: hypothetical protein ABSA70_03810 [Terriglobia bacterium]
MLVLEYDSHYQDQSHGSEAERTLVNYEEPDVVDQVHLFHHLPPLIVRLPIGKPRYCFATPANSRGRAGPSPAHPLGGGTVRILVFSPSLAFWNEDGRLSPP